MNISCVSILFITFLLGLIILSIPFRKYLPKWYTCDIFGWHGDIDKSSKYSSFGRCKKCKKMVQRDSQGNWY